MLKFIGNENEVFTRIRGKHVSYEVSPGGNYDFGELEDAFLESGKFVKIVEEKKKKTEAQKIIES